MTDMMQSYIEIVVSWLLSTTYCVLIAFIQVHRIADRVATLGDLQGILGACRVGKTRQLTQDLNYRRAGELPPVLLHPLQPDGPSPSGERCAMIATKFLVFQ